MSNFSKKFFPLEKPLFATFQRKFLLRKTAYATFQRKFFPSEKPLFATFHRKFLLRKTAYATFDEIAKEYDKNSMVQKNAGEILLELCDIKPNEDILDLGCGSGYLTSKIREKTDGKVVAIDSSKEMIKRAKKSYKNIEFYAKDANELDYEGEFDLIFSNSAFQWFNPPFEVLKRSHKALKQGGKIAIQAPAKKIYSPNFIKAVNEIKKDDMTRDIFSHFKNPWFFLETKEEYMKLFKKSGFEIEYADIKKSTSYHTPTEVFDIFDSGASAGYLNDRYYDIEISKEYMEDFKKIVKKSFEKQSGADNKVELVFYRVYIIGRKR